jgi:TRAP transporter 4TM/12TM fusion protein
VWVIFQLYTAATEPFVSQLQRSIHLGLALALTYAIFRNEDASKGLWKRILNNVCIVLGIASVGYMTLEFDRIVSRIAFVDELYPTDYFFGIVLVLLVFEASRRVCGTAMTLLALIFVVYGFAGPYIPGMFGHRGIDIKDVVEVLYFSSSGLLGEPIAVSVNYVFYFILFAAFLERSGAGQLIIDVAFRLTGKSRGGPAKAAILASSGMGTISGSAVANVVSTGVLTIPLMKKVGFSPKYAAAVESLASSGGQLLPPVMGAAAFLMANTIGVPYLQVALAAIIPAVLYYVGLYIMVHMQTIKLGITATIEQDKKEMNKSIMARIHLIIPLVFLIFMIFSNMLLQKAAFWSIVILVAVTWFKKSTRMSVKDVLDAFVDGAKQSVQVAVSCGIAGIIVGVIMHTGIGLRFTSIILDLSLGSVLLTVIMVSIACIILSMGMPTSSAYIMASVLLAPALTTLGFELMATHMFILYFAIFSMITPPVALASYSAASIAKADANETGWYCLYMAIPSFLIAFALLYNPSLVLIGSVTEIVIGTFMTLMGVVGITFAVVGYLKGDMNLVIRIVSAVGGLLLIHPTIFTSIAGLIILCGVFAVQTARSKKKHPPVFEVSS